jgi:HEAT repeat protein
MDGNGGKRSGQAVGLGSVRWTKQTMNSKFLLCLALTLSGNLLVSRADELTNVDSQVVAEQGELCQLLAKASPGASHGNLSAAPRTGSEFSPYLSESENERLLDLLRNPDVAEVVTRDQALAALKQRQLDNSLPNLQHDALMDLVNRRWPHDAVVISFYRDAFGSRGETAISDLFSPLPGVWDDSLLEPVVQFIGKNAPDAATFYRADMPGRVSWIAIDDALEVLDRHYSVWATNDSVPRRLSAAVLTIFPSLTNASSLDPRPGDQMWCNAVRMLAETHDPAMIPVLRPFLKDYILAGDGALWRDQTPVRACDEAAFAIKRLLGDKDFPAWSYSNGVVHSARNSYPKWDEWDKKFAALENRLDSLANKKAKPGAGTAANNPAKPSQADAIVEEMRGLNMQPENPLFDDGSTNSVEQRREEIIRRLRLTGDEAAPALIRALKDPGVQMRRNADLVIFELAWGFDSKPMDMRTTIPALIRITADEDGTVRAWAALALGEIGADAKAAVPALIKLVRDRDEGCRNDACIALGDIGPAAKDALPVLRNALNDPSKDVRQFAKRAIGKIQIVE